MIFFGVKRVFNFSDFITKFYNFYSVLKLYPGHKVKFFYLSIQIVTDNYVASLI